MRDEGPPHHEVPGLCGRAIDDGIDGIEEKL